MFRIDKILITANEDECYFHVLGDPIHYLDLKSVSRAHPELEMVIELNKLELERKYLQSKEINKL